MRVRGVSALRDGPGGPAAEAGTPVSLRQSDEELASDEQLETRI